LPDNATNKNVNWKSSSTSVVTVSSNGLVTAVSPGTATITVTTVDGNYSANCTVTVTSSPYGYENGHEYVDLGLPSGLRWATCNVGANSPEEYGNYFAWGETSPKSTYSRSNYKKKHYPLELSDDAARANWGGKWRMPTIADWNELKDNTTPTKISLKGVLGWKITSLRNGNSIFLPFAGNWGDSDHAGFVGSEGYYWLSTYYDGKAYYIYLNGYGIGTFNDGTPHLGRSVRPVMEK
jgi:hypothetical protein